MNSHFSVKNIFLMGFFLFFGVFATSSSLASIPGTSNPVLLALKVVEFTRNDSNPTMDDQRLSKLVKEMNDIYSACKISFQVEEYAAVNPNEYGLPFHLSSVEKMHEVRKPFDDPRYLVVIKTGSWDHKKMGAPNAWTAMPGENPSGAVLEAPVSTFAGIVAHEIGHYLSLNHVQNIVNLMNPIIYGKSNQLTEEQCNSMRTTAMNVRKAAIRQPTVQRDDQVIQKPAQKNSASQYEGGKPTASFNAAYSG